MIAGPIMPHPRFIVRGLLDGDPAPRIAGPRPADILEAGMVVLEEDLRVDETLHVDFLARDVAGMPVLVLAVDRDETDDLLQRIVDLDLWFRDNGFLLDRGLAREGSATLPLRWSDGARFLVVARDPPPRLHRRLASLARPTLAVFELRSAMLRGELLWLLQGVAPWSEGGRCVEAVPPGITDEGERELVELLLGRVTSLAPGIEIRGDRFSRSVSLGGRVLLTLRAQPGGIRVVVGGDQAATAIELRSRHEVATILDRILRVLLAMPDRKDRRGEAGATPPIALSPAEMAAFIAP
jgi:hypothetical protein